MPNYLVKACICSHCSIDTENGELCEWKIYLDVLVHTCWHSRETLIIQYFICYSYHAVLIGCNSTNEFLCCAHDCCLSVNGKPFGVGMVTKPGDICRLGLYVCTYGIKKPTLCCAGAEQFLCIKSASSLPFESGFVDRPICAFCFIKLYPTNDIGIFKEAPSCSKMSR